MIKIINGDILKCTEDIIVHQVNCHGSMGGGVARQLALQYPDVEEIYKRHCNTHKNDYEQLKNTIYSITTQNKNGGYKQISNVFSEKPGFITDYESIKECFEQIKAMAKYHNYSIAIPYKIGCGIASGDWKIVEQIIIDIFNDYDVTLYRLV